MSHNSSHWLRNSSLLIATLLLVLLFVKLLNNQANRLDDITARYKDGSAVNLNQKVKADKIADVLMLHGYVDNDTDAVVMAQLIADTLATGKYTLDKVYDLDKRIFQIPVYLADSIGGPMLKSKAADSRIKLGLCDSLVEVSLSKDFPSRVAFDAGKEQITVVVEDIDENPVKGVLVGLDRHFTDDSTNEAMSELVGFAKTGTDGTAVFDGLAGNEYYSVVPLRIGYEYGTRQGTSKDTLSTMKTKDKTFRFVEKEHRLRLFPAEVLKQIKAETSFTVRTPKEYMDSLCLNFTLLVVLWWTLFGVTRRRSRLKGQNFNPWVISLMMLLTGFCLLMMYSISNPLTEELFGAKQFRGIAIGVIVVILLQWADVDMVHFYQDKCKIKFDFFYQFFDWLMKPFRNKVASLVPALEGSNLLKKAGTLILVAVYFVATIWIDAIFWFLGKVIWSKLQLKNLSIGIHDHIWGNGEKGIKPIAKGSSYLVLALLLTSALFVIGSTVGGMRVNIALGPLTFQPSEVAKYLIVVFMAAFFCENMYSIQRFSNRVEGIFVWGKIKVLLGLLLGIAVLLALYIRLGDMGPGIVLTVTFVFFYSIVKSRVYLDNVADEQQQKKKIFSCDIAVLVCGVILFIVLIKAMDILLGVAWFGFAIWLVLWVMYCLAKKQWHETSLMMALILAVFLFAGPLLQRIPLTQSVGDRFAERNEMCENPWGHLDLHEDGMNPAINSQVADGIWGLATGGLTGQGMAHGNPNLIPAFHTDMIMESVGEQLGWIGMVFVVLVVTTLLLVTLKIGYSTRSRFGLYLCVGIAVVTAVQFAIITLGSTGVVPLTGITVPFMSYGSVSMILNIVAFGLVLSLSRTNHQPSSATLDVENEKYKEMQSHRHPIRIVSELYALFVLVLLGIFFHLQVFNRDNILIRPLYVLSRDTGIPLVEYNPRIGLLTEKMISGNIYDRNGLLLATSQPDSINVNDYTMAGISSDEILNLKKKHQRRYYPLGDQLYFMLGDINTGLYFSYRESDPRGYMAEAQHLSYLRGYDNAMYEDEEHTLPLKRDLTSNRYKSNRFLPAQEKVYKNVLIRDYSELLPYLKAGTDSRKLSRFNQGKSKDIAPHDLQLTIDALLQAQLQNKLAEYADAQGWTQNKSWNKLRMSVVVLNAHNGDLLASACYPMPNTAIIKDNADVNTYNDNNASSDFKAYTDRDLGLTYPTQPGSTAKVMSALAGLRAKGAKAINYIENIYGKEIIDLKLGEPSGSIDMATAIVKSSNCYFIHLVNHYRLYPQLDTIYRSVGISLGGVRPYTLNYAPLLRSENPRQSGSKGKWDSIVKQQSAASYSSYNTYMAQRNENPQKMNRAEWQWCWGQGSLDATPLAMARVASIPINGGKMPVTRYVLTQDAEPNSDIQLIDIVDSKAADALANAMRNQASHNKASLPGVDIAHIGGKTGTPERNCGVHKPNDGWYIFFIDNALVGEADKKGSKKVVAPLAVAVRMERINGASGVAMRCAANAVIPTLRALGYLQ